MIDYIVFFGLLLIAIIVHIISPKSKPKAKRVISPRERCESPIERRLYDALTYRGYSVTPQVHCGKYRIDLALVGYGLAIECDGKAYHSSPSQKARDRRKDVYLNANGWNVRRFTGSEINRNLKKVLNEIESYTNPK